MGDMDSVERARTQQEAVQEASKASRSADRARLWAGLNRYLAAEAEHVRKERKERKATVPPQGGPANGKASGASPRKV